MARNTGEVMGLRGSLVEHPFGTLKVWAGVHYFLGDNGPLFNCYFWGILQSVVTDRFKWWPLWPR